MNLRHDRTMIAGLLTKHFPHMEKATSDDWHGFLNEKTGLDISIDEPNANAFDQWRMALAGQGFDVWGISKAKIDEVKAKGGVLLLREFDRLKAHDATMAATTLEAPAVSAAALLRPVKK